MYLFDKAKHVHTIEGQPLFGTSTVVKEVMPPFLAKWGAQCAVDFLRDPKNSEEVTEGLYYVRTEKMDAAVGAWSKVRDKAATKGTDMHKDLEDYVQHCIDTSAGIPQWDSTFPEGVVGSFAKWSYENVGKFILSEKNTYSKEIWCGGIIDCAGELKTGELAVIDFKSSKEGYFNQYVQAGGYALQLEESGYGDFNGENWQNFPGKVNALIVIPFGAKKIDPFIVRNVDGFKDCFRNLVSIYQLQLSFKNK